MSDPREHWPAAERNRDPILDVLRRVLPAQGTVLEIASGSGQHAAYFSAALPNLQWQPTEANHALHASIAAWCAELSNVLPVIALDVLADPWPLPLARYDAVFNANMIHIAPFEVCHALLRGVAAHLVPGGRFVLYGPFKIGGQHTAESNAAFDRKLRSENPSWGVRDLEQVSALAAERGLRFVERVQMPANNQLLIFER
jgi:SAM-dependent methyltransferase